MESVSERAKEGTPAIASAIRIDPEKVRQHLDEVVRGTVEQTLNALLDAEADRLCNAGRYERSPDRQDPRPSRYPAREENYIFPERDTNAGRSPPRRRSSIAPAPAATALEPPAA